MSFLGKPAQKPHTAVDVIVIGAGFAGLYSLHLLRGMGWKVRVLEAAADVGGVWYWNRYPGARCDVESLQYSYSFSSALQQEWKWSEKYASQTEILRYLQHVAQRFDLRPDIQFNTRVQAMRFDEQLEHWQVHTEQGEVYVARFCVMATGALSMPRLPDVPGISCFKGPVYHTGHWPHEGVDFTGLRVGVIGTGSSGIQAIPQIAKQALQLNVFQRTANFSIPARNSPLSHEDQQAFKQDYPAHRARAREVGTLYEFSDKKAFDVTDQEREREYERRWNKGGVNFVHAFTDLMVNKAANDTVADFVRERIRRVVQDPAVAQALCPKDHPLGTKRICVDIDYFETYNRPNVRLVDLQATPIESVTEDSVLTRAEAFPLDALVCATGYDALTGALLQIEITGRGGLSLRDQWRDGPGTLLGLMTAGFPNMFIITGAGSPSVLVNMVVGVEQHVDWIARCLDDLRRESFSIIEAEESAQTRWVAHVNEAADKTLFPLAQSWYMGANIPGKPRVFMPYVSKIGLYRAECDRIAANNYEGFKRARVGDTSTAQSHTASDKTVQP